LKDFNGNTVTSFWAIDNTQPVLQQCQDDVSSFNNWEYATAHTSSRGNFVDLNNGPGTLGTFHNDAAPSPVTQCNSALRWVGCCM